MWSPSWAALWTRRKKSPRAIAAGLAFQRFALAEAPLIAAKKPVAPLRWGLFKFGAFGVVKA